MQTENPNNNENRDLVAELATATEQKTVSANPVMEWNFDNDDKTPGVNDPKNEPTNTTPATQNTAAQNKGEITPRMRKLDAEASQAGVEFLTSKAAEIAICIKYARKFTDEEKHAINSDLLYRAPDKLTEEQTQLVNRWKAIQKQKDAKIKKVELGEKQRERMVAAFEKYSEATGKTFLTPGSMLAISIIETVMDSALEVFID